MSRLAALLILLGSIGAAGIFFYVGVFAATGENDYVYWWVRGPLWGLAALALLLGGGAVWLAVRAGKSSPG